MNILAVDCCLKFTGLALMLNDSVVDFDSQDLGRLQSRELPLMTERILARNNITFADIDYIALTNGPGYFTGIRVGAAYASGLAYACGVKIIPVSPLEVLAYDYNSSHEKVLVLVYAGHGFVYASCKDLLPEGEYSHPQIISWLNENPDSRIISDDPEKINLNLDVNINISRVKPDVKSLCRIARENINLAVSPLELKILYYRAPQGVN
ncbi:MAG: tRNA (adenosine(37)-N6)-threonylcarbamoyltransferase complex dimerization subunit type 1 TsaB [Synergistaceae bacterium]|nr:tRNA (adenosine(37)-N6)-threonylcarbamoyltransferase complex dimerization subunit type 1 TsaB [Synergistaceae bacterium]